jgi:hypothetical protein
MLRRILEFFSLASNDLVSHVRRITRRWRSSFKQPTNDWSRSDYEFWNRAYYARAAGLELSGLLIKPIVSKLATWTLGQSPKWKLESETAQDALIKWWTDAHPQILQAWKAALRQGDSFLVINSDLTVTLLPPGAVDPIVAENDFANIIGWRVTLVLQHPETVERMTVVDEYFIDHRVHKVEINGVLRSQEVFSNLLGRLPIIHIANQPLTGEIFGHAEVEGLLPLLHRYGEVLDSAIEGNVLQGRPTPVLTFETVADLEKFDDENATIETQTLPNGSTERVKIYDVDLSQLLVASGATFEYKSPGSFTADTAKLLEVMFYLILEHSELMEFVFGTAIASSMASAETQMPIFVEFINGRRNEMVKWLVQIAEIAMGYLALITPGVLLEAPILQWEALDQQDGTLTLETVKWAYLEGLIDRRTALIMLPIDIEDPDSVLDLAEKERAEKATEFPETSTDEQDFDRDLERQIDQLEI